jgi:antitoxin FitA
MNMRISIELSSQQAKILQNAADRLGLKPEELARASLADLMGLLQDDFQKAAAYVLNKNQELYRRLS